MVIQRLHTHAVARRVKLLALPIPDCKREHAVKALHAVGAPLMVRREDDFGIGLALPRRGAGIEFAAQFEEIIDFPVEHDYIALVARDHRLVAGGRDIDDGEPPVT